MALIIAYKCISSLSNIGYYIWNCLEGKKLLNSLSIMQACLKDFRTSTIDISLYFKTYENYNGFWLSIKFVASNYRYLFSIFAIFSININIMIIITLLIAIVSANI